jgi:hypothetical protein
MKHNYLFFILAVAALPVVAQNRLYVNPAATGAATGASWADALTNLQAALALAQSGDEVWAAEGTYHPSPGTDRNQSFEPKSGVRLLGGFLGIETDPSQRNWEAHPSVLSGDIGVQGDSTDNSYNVVYLHEPDSATLFDGFTVRDGNADYAGLSASRDRRKCGGGLYMMGEDAEAYPTIRNCRFLNNTARNSGGGVCVNGDGDGSVAPLFFNCRFEANRSLGSGGGLAYLGAAWVERGVEIDSCNFLHNTAGNRGAGLLWQDAERHNQLDVNRCSFQENRAEVGGGGSQFFLGRSNGALLRLSKNIFNKNTSEQGQGVAASFSAFGFNFTKTIEIVHNDIIENYGSNTAWSNQGIIYADVPNTDTAYLSILFNKCERNTQSQYLFFLSTDKVDLNFSNNTIRNNNSPASTITFGSYGRLTLFEYCIIDSNISGTAGFVSGAEQMVSKLTGSIIANNFFSNYRIFSSKDGIQYITNSIIIDNVVCQSHPGLQQVRNITLVNSTILVPGICDLPKFLSSTSGTLLTHSYFDALDCTALPPNVTCGPGLIIGGDPMFVAPDSGDYRLQPCSPLLNAGSNAYVSTPTDLAGNARIHGGTVDIGAYEHQGPVLAADPDVQPSCPGGASGAITPDVQDACPPLSVAWQSGAASGTALTGLSPGTYQITLTDAAGQSVAFAADVPTGDAPALAPLPTPVACGDTLGGSATVSVSGATAPLVFNWGPLGTDSLLTGLPPGLYPVTVTDARGCTATGSVQVERAGNLGVTVDALGISCHGSADGSLTVLPANGKPPFSWNWSNPPGAATPTVGPLGPGTYFGTLTDAFGCNIGWVLPLGQPDPLQPGPFVMDASDSSSADGSILLVPTGGTGPYAAMWSNGGTGLLQDGLPPGAYFATVTDANGCTVATPSILVGVTTSTGEPDTAANWQVWPNPASDVAWVVLSTPAPKNLSVQLWSSDGRLVLAGMLPAGADRLALRVAGLVRGTYFAEVAGQLRKVEKL